jgi:hypothetical protein
MLLFESGLVVCFAAALVPLVRWATKACGKLLEVAFMWLVAGVVALTVVGLATRTESYRAVRGINAHEVALNATRTAAEGLFTGVGIFSRSANLRLTRRHLLDV